MKLLLIFFSACVFLLPKIRHPLMLSVVLVLAAMATGFMMFCQSSVWLFNAVILIYLGGMMILFLYISILSSSEKVFFKKTSLVPFLVIVPVAGAVSQWSSAEDCSTESGLSSSLSGLFDCFSLGLLSFLILYLLATLFTTVKFSESHKGTLMKLS